MDRLDAPKQTREARNDGVRYREEVGLFFRKEITCPGKIVGDKDIKGEAIEIVISAVGAPESLFDGSRAREGACPASGQSCFDQ